MLLVSGVVGEADWMMGFLESSLRFQEVTLTPKFVSSGQKNSASL